MEKKTKNNATMLLRLPEDLKTQLQHQADINGRRITAEINERLRVSLGARGPTFQAILAREAGLAPPKDATPPSYTQVHQPSVMPANDNGPAPALTDVDRAMLEVFKKMPVEKQLALLSLFR